MSELFVCVSALIIGSVFALMEHEERQFEKDIRRIYFGECEH